MREQFVELYVREDGVDFFLERKEMEAPFSDKTKWDFVVIKSGSERLEQVYAGIIDLEGNVLYILEIDVDSKLIAVYGEQWLEIDESILSLIPTYDELQLEIDEIILSLFSEKE